MTVYLLHLTPPLAHARHYIGYTPDSTASRRIAEHLRGTGNQLIKAAIKAGCEILVPHVWTGAPREFERWLKSRRDTARWCPCCDTRTLSLPVPERMTARFLADKPVYPPPP